MNSEVSFFLIVIISFVYMIHFFWAIYESTRQQLFLNVFDYKKILSTIFLIITTLIVPLLLSYHVNDNIFVFSFKEWDVNLTLNILIIYIALEFSLLGTLNQKTKSWFFLLVLAIVVDLITLYYLRHMVQGFHPEMLESYALYLCFFSSISSYAIILFAMIAGKKE